MLYEPFTREVEAATRLAPTSFSRGTETHHLPVSATHHALRRPSTVLELFRAVRQNDGLLIDVLDAVSVLEGAFNVLLHGSRHSVNLRLQQWTKDVACESGTADWTGRAMRRCASVATPHV